MRYLLYESEHGKTNLSSEISFMSHYVDLMKLRLSQKVELKVDFPQVENNIEIPPLLFIPFIENAFKHVSNKKTEHAITIRITSEEKQLRFECENQFGTTTTLTSNGLGNDLIEKRLTLLYPKRHTLVLSNQDHLYQVNLVIKNE